MEGLKKDILLREKETFLFSNFLLTLQKIPGMTGNCQKQPYWQAIDLQAADNGKSFREVTIFSII